MDTIGFIGAGVMGASMVRNLLKAGYPVYLHTRTRAKAEPLLAEGASWTDSPAAVAEAADVIITIIGYPKDVEAVYLGEGGLVATARSGSLLIDMTTSSPALARRIAEVAAARGIDVLDAPVSGGDIGAREGTLTIMAGGEKEAFERARPVFEVLGKSIRRLGGAGAGQLTKMANQIAVAASTLGAAEALAFARSAGLDVQAVLDTIGGGAAASWSLSKLGPRMVAGDFAPGFYAKHLLKDLGIALESAREMGMSLPGLELAQSLYDAMVRDGFGEQGTQGIYHRLVGK
ncbi:MAG: NAD(P)-dependent oxidoreductase [Verrucomicrobiota bacterium JB024]|nr:NAD(P)-dependent oxidoreductase [Verrucomicrobiota bacterium JB024]